MNSLGADIIQLITQTLKPGGPGDKFEAFVITNDATNFSVGANLMLLLMAVQEEEWDDVDMAIRQFQGMTQAIKFSPKPVVVGAVRPDAGRRHARSRCTLPARQPHAELYMGLVEVGVGLLPGGGGCKEMLLRAVDSAQFHPSRRTRRIGGTDGSHEAERSRPSPRRRSRPRRMKRADSDFFRSPTASP